MPGSLDYNVGRQIAASRPPFDALIFAAMEGADSTNAARLALGFPELVAEWRRLRDLPPAGRRIPAEPEQQCECVLNCEEDPASACSLSGFYPHAHPLAPCPVHPDAPGDH